MKIITNNHERYFQYWHDVPDEVRDWYDWLGEDNDYDGWIEYKGNWSHISDYLAVHNEFHNPNPPDWMIDWHGYKPDSFFSGTLIRVQDDCETYQIATWIG